MTTLPSPNKKQKEVFFRPKPGKTKAMTVEKKTNDGFYEYRKMQLRDQVIQHSDKQLPPLISPN